MKLKDYIIATWQKRAVGQAAQLSANTAQRWHAWLIRAGLIPPQEYVYCLDTLRYNARINSVMCDHGQVWFTNAVRLVPVVSHYGRLSAWQQCAVDLHSFFCNASRMRYDRSCYTAVILAETGFCVNSTSAGVYRWGGAYHNVPCPQTVQSRLCELAFGQARARCEDDCDEDDDYDCDEDDDYEEENDEACGRATYHSDKYTRRRWAAKTPDIADVFGVELEMKAYDSSSLERICSRAKAQGFLAEYDGSLDESRGVEIVAPPFHLKQFRKGAWGKLMADLRGLGEGWDAGTEYGIHISINRLSLSGLEQSMFMRFFRANKKFCEAIAGRKGNTWCIYAEVSWSIFKSDETNRYYAAAIRSEKRIEVRIFRSTLKASSFLKNVQFVAALVEFVRHTSIRHNTHEHFVEFISQKARRNRYRELLAFLAEKNLNGSSPAAVC